jgi:hypothetical protein
LACVQPALIAASKQTSNPPPAADTIALPTTAQVDSNLASAAAIQKSLDDNMSRLGGIVALEARWWGSSRGAATAIATYNAARLEYIALTGSELTLSPPIDRSEIEEPRPDPASQVTRGSPAAIAASNETAPDGGTSTDAAPPATEPDEAAARRRALGQVAMSYAGLAAWPLFEHLFFLPSGAVVALFTGVMGAIGAGVYSLLTKVNEAQTAREGLWRRFAMRPLLGATTGFMVFFVISAGAAFLVQPNGGGAIEAVNSLSPPALASLGVFAGLAAEKALHWLKEGANSFFKTDGDESRENADSEQGPAQGQDKGKGKGKG